MSKTRLGLILFIASESVFFILLILAYMYFRNSSTGPTAANSLDPLVTGIFSIFLYSSSYTVWRAEVNVRKGKPGRMMMWLIVTILFGLVFLSGQAYEWRNLILQGTTISTNLFGTTFFTLTGFHGLHVIVGLIMLSIVLGMTVYRSMHGAEAKDGISTISIYWHFVDAVWVIIFSLVYLTLVL